jgi:hypothetical protein
MGSVCLHGAVLWCSQASLIMKHENHILLSLHYLKVCIRYQVLLQVKWENDYRLGSIGNKTVMASLKEPSQHLPGITKVITTNLNKYPIHYVNQIYPRHESGVLPSVQAAHLLACIWMQAHTIKVFMIIIISKRYYQVWLIMRPKVFFHENIPYGWNLIFKNSLL